MTIDDLLVESAGMWPEHKRPELSEVIVRMGKVFGDICRWERNAIKDQDIHTEAEIKKEFGNIIFSSIRWCHDLGFDPKECISLAIECQKQGSSGLTSVQA